MRDSRKNRDAKAVYFRMTINIELLLGELTADVKNLTARMARHEESNSEQFDKFEESVTRRLTALEDAMLKSNTLMAEIRGGTRVLRWLGTIVVALVTFVATTLWWFVDKWNLIGPKT